ncbi:hypothetical protein ACJIZ3_006428 [Penstemon smallii]|uniref:Uncharacterized protein n=1 Tax=Penstemon smallii TaxID=265156 RepID=A0ABD3S7R0_9LAMI
MGGEEEGWGAAAPNSGPLYIQKDDHWTHFDNSVSAVSFGFVATAILISMFLVMAIFEKFLRTTTSPPQISTPAAQRLRRTDIESHNHIGGSFNSKIGYPSLKVRNWSTNLHLGEIGILVPQNWSSAFFVPHFIKLHFGSSSCNFFFTFGLINSFGT